MAEIIYFHVMLLQTSVDMLFYFGLDILLYYIHLRSSSLPPRSKSLMFVSVCATEQLDNMLAMQVALLIQVGREGLPPEIAPKIIAAKDRKELAKVALSAPPHGLYLMSVNYDKEILKPPVGSPPVSFGRTHQINRCKLLFY